LLYSFLKVLLVAGPSILLKSTSGSLTPLIYEYPSTGLAIYLPLLQQLFPSAFADQDIFPARSQNACSHFSILRSPNHIYVFMKAAIIAFSRLPS
jgi:hypothetical protein